MRRLKRGFIFGDMMQKRGIKMNDGEFRIGWVNNLGERRATGITRL